MITKVVLKKKKKKIKEEIDSLDIFQPILSNPNNISDEKLDKFLKDNLKKDVKLQKFLNKNYIKAEIVNLQGKSGGWPEIEFIGPA